ncbi:MAG: ABC transporter permease [Deltaproteobacteria bacterium]|jgi:putative ABC transport system permease protein|nr:ABC transporter permease [Deltaproteobacteria bacterium]
MLWKMIFGAIGRQRRKHYLIALTVALGVSLATAMLGVMFDVGDKVNQELKSYGANLNIVPKGTSLLGDLYLLEEDPAQAGEKEEVLAENFLEEKDLFKIKMIFWAYNIVDFAPYLTVPVRIGEQKVLLNGTWLAKHLKLPTGDEADTGMLALKSWWNIEGEKPSDEDTYGVMVGRDLARQLNLAPGSPLEISLGSRRETLTVRSVFDSGGSEDGQIFGPLALAQSLAGKEGLADRVEVSALTTPENELARRAALNPGSLSRLEWDTWYCTAYISSIAYQLEEILPGVRVKAIRQVAESEGEILTKIQLMMILLTVLTLICSALAISNLVSAGILERSVEIGLLKALGASNAAVIFLVLLELSAVALAGGVLGYLLGLGVAQVIGLTVFGSWVEIKTAVIPLTALMVLLVTLLGSLPALRALLNLEPAEVLHGR